MLFFSRKRERDFKIDVVALIENMADAEGVEMEEFVVR